MCELGVLVDHMELTEKSVVIAKLPADASPEQWNNTTEMLAEILPPGAKSIVIPHDFEVSVIESSELPKEKK